MQRAIINCLTNNKIIMCEKVAFAVHPSFFLLFTPEELYRSVVTRFRR